MITNSPLTWQISLPLWIPRTAFTASSRRKQPVRCSTAEVYVLQISLTSQDLQERIKQLGSLAQVGGERQDAKESILDGLSKLTSEVADASSFVPAYDQRNYSQARASAGPLTPAFGAN